MATGLMGKSTQGTLVFTEDYSGFPGRFSHFNRQELGISPINRSWEWCLRKKLTVLNWTNTIDFLNLDVDLKLSIPGLLMGSIHETTTLLILPFGNASRPPWPFDSAQDSLGSGRRCLGPSFSHPSARGFVDAVAVVDAFLPSRGQGGGPSVDGTGHPG